MTPDLLDTLLDHSAPETRAADELDLASMIADAATEAAPRRPRRRRLALAGGALALVLVSGAGAAAATGGFTWAPWAQDPVGALSFTMPNGFSCELRFSPYTGGSDPAFIADVNRTLQDWYRSTDVVAAAESLLPQERVHIAEMEAAAPSDPGADMSGLSPAERAKEIEHRAFASEWMAWELAVSDLETQELSRHGTAPADDRFAGSERAGQIQCTDESGALYVPGAGS